MKRSVFRFLAASALLTTAGCSDVWEPTPKTTPLVGDTAISNTASLSHTFVRAPKSALFTCSQPYPDAAFDQGEAADIDISLISLGGDEGGGEEEDSEEAEMAGRTPTVLMTRELFYRACEYSHNFKLDKKEALTLYNKTLDAVTKVWATEAGNTTVTIGDTVTTTTGATVTSTISGTVSETETKTDSDTESATSDTSTSN